MELTHTSIITAQVEELKTFYKDVLCMAPSFESAKYVEFEIGKGKLSLFDQNEHDLLAYNSAEPKSNRSVMIEIHVEDVDREYERLVQRGIEFVKGPTTQEWGNRSIYFRDLDGNLINFYSKTI